MLCWLHTDINSCVIFVYLSQLYLVQLDTAPKITSACMLEHMHAAHGQLHPLYRHWFSWKPSSLPKVYLPKRGNMHMHAASPNLLAVASRASIQ